MIVPIMRLTVARTPPGAAYREKLAGEPPRIGICSGLRPLPRPQAGGRAGTLWERPWPRRASSAGGDKRGGVLAGPDAGNVMRSLGPTPDAVQVAEPADKPGPVLDSHSSRRSVTATL